MQTLRSQKFNFLRKQYSNKSTNCGEEELEALAVDMHSIEQELQDSEEPHHQHNYFFDSQVSFIREAIARIGSENSRLKVYATILYLHPLDEHNGHKDTAKKMFPDSSEGARYASFSKARSAIFKILEKMREEYDDKGLSEDANAIAELIQSMHKLEEMRSYSKTTQKR